MTLGFAVAVSDKSALIVAAGCPAPKDGCPAPKDGCPAPKDGCPARTRTSINGIRNRCLTIRRRGIMRHNAAGRSGRLVIAPLWVKGNCLPTSPLPASRLPLARPLARDAPWV